VVGFPPRLPGADGTNDGNECIAAGVALYHALLPIVERDRSRQPGEHGAAIRAPLGREWSAERLIVTAIVPATARRLP
jgi:hypothetical protein